SHTRSLVKTFVLELLFGLSVESPGRWVLFLAVTLIASTLTLLGMGWRQWILSPRTLPVFGLTVSLYAFFHLWIHCIWLAVDAHYLWPLLPLALFFAFYAIDHSKPTRFRIAGQTILLVSVGIVYIWQAAYAVREASAAPAENRRPDAMFEWI